MVSSKINELTEEDLNYLETVLNREFRKQVDYVTAFKSKNHYDPGDKTKKLARLLDAVRSQRKLVKMPKW